MGAYARRLTRATIPAAAGGGGGGAVPPVVLDVWTASTRNGSPVNFTFPTAPAAGECIVVVAAVNDRGGYAPYATGYTPGVANPAGGPAGTMLALSSKIMGSTPDTSVQVNSTGSAQDAMSVIIYRIVGVASSGDAAAGADTGVATGGELNEQTFSAPPVTVAGAALVLSAFGVGSNPNNVQINLVGYTNDASASETDTNRATVASAHLAVDTAGFHDPGVWTVQNYTVGLTFAVATLALEG